MKTRQNLLVATLGLLTATISALLAVPVQAGGPPTDTYTASPTCTSTHTISPSPTVTFTPLPTPNGLHVQPICIVTRVAGQYGFPGYAGDGGPALNCRMFNPLVTLFDPAGNLYFVDLVNHMVRKIDTGGTITRFAGKASGSTPVFGYSGEGLPANDSALYSPHDITFDQAGNMYIADRSNHRIRKVSAATGLMTTYAGTGVAAFSLTDGVPAAAVPIGSPAALAIDAFDNLYVLENTVRIRKITPAGIASTYAGLTYTGNTGDGGPATAATFSAAGISFDPAGNMLVADASNHRIRKIDRVTGIVSAYAGTGTPGTGGMGNLANLTDFNLPTNIDFDAYGDAFVSDRANERFVKIDMATFRTEVLVGTGVGGYSGDGGPAYLAQIRCGFNIAFSPLTGDGYFADAGGSMIRKVYACPPDVSPTPTPTSTISPVLSATASESPTPTHSPTNTPSFTPTATPTASLTASPSQSPTATSADTFTKTATSTPANTPAATATTTIFSSPSPSPTATIVFTLSPSPTSSAVSSATATPSSSPSATVTTPSPTTSPTQSRTTSPTPSLTTTLPGASNTPTETVTPSLSASETPSHSATVTPTNTSSVTPSATASSTATPSRTPTPTISATVTGSATFSATMTRTATPSQSPTATAIDSTTPSATPTATPVPGIATPSPTPTWNGSHEGQPNLSEVQAAPNPNPERVFVLLEGSVDSLRLTLFTPGMTKVLEVETGYFARGWQSILLEPDKFNQLPNGLYYYRVEAVRGENIESKSGTLMILR